MEAKGESIDIEFLGHSQVIHLFLGPHSHPPVYFWQLLDLQHPHYVITCAKLHIFQIISTPRVPRRVIDLYWVAVVLIYHCCIWSLHWNIQKRKHDFEVALVIISSTYKPLPILYLI